LRARRSSRDSTFSSSKDTGAWLTRARAVSSNALTLTTAYSRPSISLLTTGTTPHRRQTWNVAVRVPKA